MEQTVKINDVEASEIIAKADQRAILETYEPNRRRAPNPVRAAQLATLQARRDSGAKPAVITGDGGRAWGFSAVMIPPLDMQVLLTLMPDLNSPDQATHDAAWRKFIASPASAPYRTDASIGKRKANTGIIIR